MSQIYDLKNDIKVVNTIMPQAATADVTGAGVDTLGFNSATLIGIADDALVGSFVLQESDDNSTFTAVSDDQVITSDGSNTTAAAASSSITIGYVGTKRYLRAFWDHTTNGDGSAVIVLGHPQAAPTGANS